MGIDGVGWGTAVTRDRVWITSFNGKILVLDFNGRPVGKESDFPFKEKFLGLMGIGIAANGDVWIADGSDNQLLCFPGGRVKDGRIVKVAGLKSPFDIVIDDQNRVWVSNSQSDKVVRFPVDDPSKAESFRAGIGVRALALDSKGNVWVASNMSLDFPPPVIPDGASIMIASELAALHSVLLDHDVELVLLAQGDAEAEAGDRRHVPQHKCASAQPRCPFLSFQHFVSSSKLCQIASCDRDWIESA
jgi:hypothetical protein